MLCVAVFLISPTILADTEEEARDHRQTHGFYEVVQVDALIRDFQAGRISEAAFTAEIWEQYPVLTAALYAQWGTINTCFLKDLAFGQTNGAIAYQANGDPIFFDTAQCLDSNGNVLPGRAREYNTASRANAILLEAFSIWQADPICQGSPPLNNKCCDPNSPLPRCIPQTGKRCKMDAGGQNCVAGSTQC